MAAFYLGDQDKVIYPSGDIFFAPSEDLDKVWHFASFEIWCTGRNVFLIRG